MYPAELVAPMSKELTDNGFTGLLTPEDVTSAIEEMKGTALMVVNSVCGLVHFLERHHIEGRSAGIIADNLKQAFDHFC